MSKKQQYVRASDIGRAAFCPHAMSLSKVGAKASDDAKARMQRGEEKHQEMGQKIDADRGREKVVIVILLCIALMLYIMFG
ncbi:hypothetical protein [Motilimonas pumila]|uniref:Uncharacterized protein n=1 Tax=Motilimonas pumila TaxID=2303987 RepID=A0A418YA33_9GAMM|nr:hypothetical protein [Motilimonas pumila]RJG38771.1 hypothetical protein D1Z90_18680 [Motilimonas pumila]